MRQSEVPVKVPLQSKSRIIEETGGSVFSHKHAVRINMNSLQLFQPRAQRNSSCSAVSTYHCPGTQQEGRWSGVSH